MTNRTLKIMKKCLGWNQDKNRAPDGPTGKFLWMMNRCVNTNSFALEFFRSCSRKNKFAKFKNTNFCLETEKIIDWLVQYSTCIKHYGTNFASSTLTFERHILNIKGGNIIWNGLTKEVTHYFRTLKDTTAISFWWFECSL